MRTRSYGLRASMFAGAALLAVGGATAAETYPDAVAASPDVYKVIAETDDMRMVLATWKPGQSDAMHSHPALVGYALTNCEKMREVYPDGSSVPWTRRAGSAGQQAPMPAHSIANGGKAVCRLLFVERKP